MTRRASAIPSPTGKSTASTRSSFASFALRARIATAPALRSLRSATPAALQHVVENDQAADADQPEAGLVVGIVLGLVGVDEGEVEAPRLAFGLERGERLERRREAERDLLRDAGLLPVRPGDRRPLLVHVAGDHPPTVRQRQGDRERAVAGEGADLQRQPRPDQPDQEGEELALLGRDLHITHRHSCRSSRGASRAPGARPHAP